MRITLNKKALAERLANEVRFLTDHDDQTIVRHVGRGHWLIINDHLSPPDEDLILRDIPSEALVSFVSSIDTEGTEWRNRYQQTAKKFNSVWTTLGRKRKPAGPVPTTISR